ncbi:hypothetical protein KW795_02095, partial [Candidatus Microgenomates bacterium]|nr:hypothetical protein [Candidatus Microgenomates bacterium]
ILRHRLHVCDAMLNIQKTKKELDAKRETISIEREVLLQSGILRRIAIYKSRISYLQNQISNADQILLEKMEKEGFAITPSDLKME